MRVLDGGRYMPGLVRYLVGPGEANEHTDPHLVAASGSVAEEFAGSEWDAAKAGELANVLDGAWREARRSAGLRVIPEPGERSGGGALNPEHVFHVSLSLGPDQGRLSDEQWGSIARDYVTAMDFTAAGGKAECQWAAVRHGLSSGGNDHVHIAVCLVREDGTRASVWQSKMRSRRAADAIEKKYGLRPVKDTSAERGLPGHTAAEAAKAERLGRPEPDRYAVARRVRAAAATSTSEAEFVRAARGGGVLLRPRFAAETTDVIEGYSAALRPTSGERPIWFSGSRLDRNLGLPALRRGCGWEDTPEAASEAAEEWRRANKAWQTTTPAARPAAGRGGEPGLPAGAARAIAEVNARLAAVDPGDRVAWRHAARDAAGVFAVWSLRAEGANPGPLARASDALARSAQPVRGEEASAATGTGMGGRHLSLLARASSKRSAAGWVAVLRQLDRTTQAVHDAHLARGEGIRARQIAAEAGRGLAQVRSQTTPAAPAGEAVTPPQQQEAGAAAGRNPRTPEPRLHDPLRRRGGLGYPGNGGQRETETGGRDRE